MSAPEVVFIRGCPRTGTTLLLDILDEQPGVGIMHEYPFERLTHQLLPILAFGQTVDNFYASVSGKSTNGGPAGSDALHYTMREQPVALKQRLRYPTRERFPAILTAVLEASFDKPNLRIIGSKTPRFADGYEMDLVRQVFDDVRFIFCVRNPLDTINSTLNRRNLAQKGLDEWHIKNATEAVSEFRENIGLLRSHAIAYPGRCFVLAYEDMMADTDATLQALGAFLGIEVRCDPRMVVARPSKSVLAPEEEALARRELGSAIDSWDRKRKTGPAEAVLGEFDDCLAVLEPGKDVAFNAAVSDRGMLGMGWWALDGNGVWSDAAIADVHFRIATEGRYAFTLTFAGNVLSPDSPLPIVLEFDGQPALQGTIADARGLQVRLATQCTAGAHRLTFRFSALRSAQELGRGGDYRRLGVFLQGLRLDPDSGVA